MVIQILLYLAIYVVIGMLFTAFLNSISKAKNPNSQEEVSGALQAAFWPVLVLVFLMGFLTGLYRALKKKW